jgi:hypothetical protein
MQLNQQYSGRPRNGKLLVAVIGASAVVAMGAVAVAIHEEQSGIGNLAGGMQLGSTSTVATPPSTPDTSIAAPAVKATPYKGK